MVIFRPGKQCQDSSGSNCERIVGRSMKNHFYTRIGTLNSLKVFGMCWRRLCWTLIIVNLDQKCRHLLMEITSQHLFPLLSICLFKLKQIETFFFWPGSADGYKYQPMT